MIRAMRGGHASNAPPPSNPNRSAFAQLASVSATAYNASSTGLTPSGWVDLKLGAGGYITGISISADGVTKVVRTDTYGAYRLVGSTWKQLVTDASMPVADRLPNSQIGCYEIVVAPSNSNRVYMAWGKIVYRSDDAGDTWTATGLTNKTFDPNTIDKLFGPKMAVDPINPDVVYFGVLNDNLYLTTNGGGSWTTVSTAQVPAAGSMGYTGMAFDPSGGTSGGRTNNFYVCSSFHGLYRTTNQGSTFTNLTGGPNLSTNFVCRSDVDPTNGVYYASVSTTAGSGVVWRYTPTGNVWFQSTSNTNYEAHGIGVDPNNHLHIVFHRIDGNGVAQSNDGGATWDYTAIFPPQALWVSSDVPWLANSANLGHTSGSDLVYDPVVANKIWISEGIAPWNTTVSYGATTVTWTSVAAGIEQLVVNKIVAPEGNLGVLVATWDRATFLITNFANFPSTYKPTGTVLDATWDLDYAGGTPAFIVGNHGDNQGLSLLAGYSTDGGANWTTFPTMPLGATSPYTYGFGAMTVCTDTQHIVWVGAPNQWPYYSANRGTAWAACTIAGLTNPGDVGNFIWSYTLNRHIVSADKVTSNVVYLFSENTSTPAKRGFWKSTDGGVNFTRVGPTIPITTDISAGTVGSAVYWAGFNAQLAAVPGQAGHLFFTQGQIGSAPDSLTSDGWPFIHSTDGGATWSVISNVQEVYCFGFGKAVAAGYPAIYIVGWVGGVYGIWRSDNEAASWTNIGTYPMGIMDWATTISGDMDIYGNCYVGFRGSGAAYRTLT